MVVRERTRRDGDRQQEVAVAGSDELRIAAGRSRALDAQMDKLGMRAGRPGVEGHAARRADRAGREWWIEDEWVACTRSVRVVARRRMEAGIRQDMLGSP